MLNKDHLITWIASDATESAMVPALAPNHVARIRSAWLPCLILVCGIALTAMLWQSERTSNAQQLQSKFNSLVRQTEVLIVERMDVYEQVLLGTKGLFAASTIVTRKDFHDYVAGLQLEAHYPGIQGIGFSLLVPPIKKQQTVKEIRSEGFPNFAIHPEGDRDLYTSVIYLEPFNTRNQQAFGYDMYSDQIVPRQGDLSQGLRRTAMEQARDTGAAFISGKVKLLMEIDNQVQAGFLMYLPVYKNDTPVSTQEERRANLQGWVYAPFRVDDLMAGILGERSKDIEVKIFDGKLQNESSLLYTLGAWHKEASSERRFESNRKIVVAGHEWHLAIRTVPGFGNELVGEKPLLIASTGLVISILFAFITWILILSRARAIVSSFALRHELGEREKMQDALHAAEIFARSTIDALSEHICVIDTQGTVLAANAAWHHCDDLNCPMINCHVGGNYLSECEFAFFASEKQLNEILTGIRAVLSGATRQFYFEYAGSTGNLPPTFAVRVSSFNDDIHKIVVVQEDISERKRGEEWMRLAASVFDSVIEAITVTDANCNIIAVNPAFTQITGYLPAEVIGKNPRILQSGRHDRSFYNDMWKSLNTHGRWQGEIWNKGKSGALIAEWISISAIKGADGMIDRYVAVFSDITEKKKMEKLVWDQANFDALTSLPNRLLFLDRLTMEIRKSEIHTQSFALFFIDLDNFKEVNESLGHHSGDKLLILAAQRISRCLRASDTVGRLGGDEFTVLLTDINDPARIEFVVQEVLDRLSEPFIFDSERVYLTASIGITLFPIDAIAPSDLFKNADQALYAAKNAGRNRFSYFTKTMEASAKLRQQTLNDLRGAIASNQLKVFFQPILDIETNQVFKAEALLRWFHPERGMISPAVFIPIAEESGLIHEIGDWVFKESASWALRWSKQIGRSFQISVNKSPVQFHEEAKGVSWTDYLHSLSLPGNCISVEITEGLLLNAASSVDGLLSAYSNAGMQISIDDFGTGYSSMSYLKKFHIDYLKIDQSFVRDMEIDAADRAIAEAIIVMAHKLGCKVIAEGIETEGQRKILLDAGCDFGQGYLFSKAVSPEEFESLFIYEARTECL